MLPGAPGLLQTQLRATAAQHSPGIGPGILVVVVADARPHSWGTVVRLLVRSCSFVRAPPWTEGPIITQTLAVCVESG